MIPSLDLLQESGRAQGVKTATAASASAAPQA
jgi:hypothetical protein